MTYAVQDDIDELYGEDLLVRIADPQRTGMPDPAIVQRGLTEADTICDAYLSAQYTVPVSPAPGVVRTCAIDIAVYKIALGANTRTTEMRQRYEDALAMLERISTGKIGLGLAPQDDGTGTGNTIDPNAKAKGRIFEVGRG